MERRLITEYEATIEALIAKLNGDNHSLALKITSIPEEIRGYGHIKERRIAAARAKQEELLAVWRAPAAVRTAA